jgi:hypothetical protein
MTDALIRSAAVGRLSSTLEPPRGSRSPAMGSHGFSVLKVIMRRGTLGSREEPAAAGPDHLRCNRG